MRDDRGVMDAKTVVIDISVSEGAVVVPQTTAGTPPPAPADTAVKDDFGVKLLSRRGRVPRGVLFAG
jgi:hypothetical protein